MKEELKPDFKNLKIAQLGFIFKDIKKQAKIWEELFNVPKFSFIPPHTIEYFYRGKKTDVTVSQGFSRCFNLQLEFVQHIEGESYHQEFLEKGKEGLHHISILVENLESYIKQFKKMGIEQISGGQRGKQVFAHFDTEDSLGILLELQETKKRERT